MCVCVCVCCVRVSVSVGICICICICIYTHIVSAAVALCCCACSFCAPNGNRGYQMRLHPGPLLLTLLKWSLLVSLLLLTSPLPASRLLPLPSSARLFTFVIVAVVLNLASYCLAVSVAVAVAVPVRVPSTPFSSHRVYSVFVHKRRPQKEPKTMGDKGHSGRELLLCLWRGSNGDGVRPGAGEGGQCSGRCRYVAVTLSGRFHTDTGRQWQQQRQQLYKSQTCDCLARQELPQPVPDPSARPVRVPVSVHSSRFPFLLLLAQRYPVKV